MIRMNLIDAAERVSMTDTVSTVHVTSVSGARAASRKKSMTILVAALFAVVAISCVFSVFGVPAALQGVLPKSYLSLIGAEQTPQTSISVSGTAASEEARAAQAAAIAKMREAMTVNQVVGEINPQALFNSKRGDYNAMLPLEKIAYQRASLSQFFSFMSTATPDDIGFSSFVYQAPNFFYVRGLSEKPASQKSFLDRLKAVSANFKTPALPENATTEVVAMGRYKVSKVDLKKVNSFVASSEIPAELKALKALAATHKVIFKGFEKPVIEDFGVYKRYAYVVSTTAIFPEIQEFVAALVESPIRMGIQKTEMKFAKKDIVTSMRFEMLVLR